MTSAWIGLWLTYFVNFLVPLLAIGLIIVVTSVYYFFKYKGLGLSKEEMNVKIESVHDAVFGKMSI